MLRSGCRSEVPRPTMPRRNRLHRAEQAGSLPNRKPKRLCVPLAIWACSRLGSTSDSPLRDARHPASATLHRPVSPRSYGPLVRLMAPKGERTSYVVAPSAMQDHNLQASNGGRDLWVKVEARPFRSDPHFSFEGTNQCTTTIRSYCANWLPPTERALSRSRTGRGFSLRLRMIWNRTLIGWREKALRMTVAPQLDCVTHGATCQAVLAIMSLMARSPCHSTNWRARQ